MAGAAFLVYLVVSKRKKGEDKVNGDKILAQKYFQLIEGRGLVENALTQSLAAF